jgi:uncharacterized SAM-binding protein YcdF (DUF218 family)
MFESELCDRPFPDEFFKLPLFADLSSFGWRKQLLLGVLVFLVLFIVIWLLQKKQLRRWLCSWKGALVLFGLTAILPLTPILAEKALVAFLPSDPGGVTNAIVVLGRGREFYDRIDVAAELWQAKRAPTIFVSGNGDAPVMIKRLQEKGIPQQALKGENCSLTTWENGAFTAAMLLPQGQQRILLVTDAPHMWRSLLVYQALGFSVIPQPVKLSSDFSYRTKAFLTFREYMGLISYTFRGLFSKQHLSELKNPELANLINQAQQYSQQQRF